jgi:host factor-I protein
LKDFSRDGEETEDLAILIKILYVRIKKTRRRYMTTVTKSLNLQDSYLNQLRKEKIPVVIYLTNGVRLKGLIKGFDNFVILLKENSQSLIYKHAVSTIVPERDVEIGFEDQS